jgi:hypothetical protein
MMEARPFLFLLLHHNKVTLLQLSLIVALNDRDMPPSASLREEH